MFNMICDICLDELFTLSSQVHITRCGHMYHTNCIRRWLEISPTCPQCRQPCLQISMRKVFFNIPNLDRIPNDIGSLKQELNNATLINKTAEKELNNLKKEITKLENIQKMCFKTIGNLQKRLNETKLVIESYSKELKICKINSNLVEEQRKEIKELKHKIDLVKTVDTILTSTTNDVAKLVNEFKNKETLATCVITLKRELRGSEYKCIELRNALKISQYNARKDVESKKLLLEKINKLENENYYTNNQINQLINDNKKFLKQKNENVRHYSKYITQNYSDIRVFKPTNSNTNRLSYFSKPKRIVISIDDKSR